MSSLSYVAEIAQSVIPRLVDFLDNSTLASPGFWALFAKGSAGFA
jgi:hypothetical protein